MLTITPIVEGHGDVYAVPALVRRCWGAWSPNFELTVQRPVRVSRTKIVKDGELERAVQLAAQKSEGGTVLIVLDADNDCPARLGPQLLARAVATVPGSRVVVAKTEFEAWFIAAAESISGQRGLSADLVAPEAPEDIRDAKGWLTRQMFDPRSRYSETLDQVALTEIFDIDLARGRSASFDKFCRELESIFDAARPADAETPV